MVSPDLKTTHEDLSSRLQRLMFLRVVFVSLLLGASVFIQIRQTRTYFGNIQTTHYALIVTIYFLSFVYVVLLKRLKSLIRLAYAQLLVDTLLVTAIIYSTGGIESIFSFLYILTIIYGSIILYRSGGMIIASMSSILYALMVGMHYYGIISPQGIMPGQSTPYQEANLVYTVLANIAAFYLVAFLSSYASEQTRKSRVELRAKQADIVKLEALNEWIIRSITSGLITLDDNERIISFNPAAEVIFGISGESAIGKKAGEVLPSVTEQVQNRLSAADRDPDGFIDSSYQRPDGKRLFLRCSVSPLHLPGGSHGGHILFFQDMSAMKQIEEEMRKVEGLAMVGELAAGIAHEIRNPMASISGSIQMLKENLEADSMNSRLMDIILREVSRLNSLVNDFLLFARPKQAKIESFDLNQLILESLELIKNSGKWVDRIDVHSRFSQSLRVESDPQQVRQVLWNLFLNASEAMPHGGSLYVSTEMVNSADVHGSDRKTVKVTIRDTGRGFSEEALQYLFTPFFTTKEGGSGLGLATVKRIVEGLRGHVYGNNNAEGGAEITVLLDTNLSLSS
jgi:two-component system sensor histidine kinase PilS (NtrC family)